MCMNTVASYNYFLSQVRIRVEQSLGQYSVKWQILRKPRETKLSTSSIVLTTCARLHNFIVDNIKCWKQYEEVTSEDVVGHLNEICRLRLTTLRSPPEASCFLRDIIVKYIEQNGYRRPNYNRIRNEELQERSGEFQSIRKSSSDVIEFYLRYGATLPLLVLSVRLNKGGSNWHLAQTSDDLSFSHSRCIALRDLEAAALLARQMMGSKRRL